MTGKIVTDVFSKGKLTRLDQSTVDTELFVKGVVLNVSFSALADAGDFMKRLSVQPAGMSAFNFFEPSLSTQTRPWFFRNAVGQRLS